jgi:hypothetical protein
VWVWVWVWIWVWVCARWLRVAGPSEGGASPYFHAACGVLGPWQTQALCTRTPNTIVRPNCVFQWEYGDCVETSLYPHFAMQKLPDAHAVEIE